MKLLLRRIACRPTYTIGKLYIDGTYFCDTVEDKDRGLTKTMSVSEIKKIKDVNKDGIDTNDGKTAIPRGIYDITMNVQSPKYSKRAQYAFCKGFVPRLCNVPGFDGILIHIGNTAEDSAGCILVGKNTMVGQVLDSTRTFRKLFHILNQANIEGEKISIEITK